MSSNLGRSINYLIRFEEEVRSLQSTVLSLKQSKSSLEQEVMELKEKLEEVCYYYYI